MPKNSKKPQLSDISGIGPKTVEKLQDAGVKTVAKLAKSNPAKLSEKVDGLGMSTAKKIVEAAKKISPKKKLKTKARKKKPSKKKTAKEKPPSEQMIDELIVELQSADQQVALGAVDRLVNNKDDSATDVLIDLLDDDRYMIRLQAALNLGKRGDKKAIDPLIESLDDDSLFVRQTAAGALESIGGSKAMKAIKVAEKKGLLLNDLPEGIRL